jgi:hypothetical protein
LVRGKYLLSLHRLRRVSDFQNVVALMVKKVIGGFNHVHAGVYQRLARSVIAPAQDHILLGSRRSIVDFPAAKRLKPMFDPVAITAAKAGISRREQYNQSQQTLHAF